ncbi:MAG: YhjD/YihY/BrkB family envelope integrity protein [Vicinamibacteria bacterium]
MRMTPTPPTGSRGAFRRVLARRLRNPLPLAGYLFLSIETHALCGALAFFAMLGFYPLSLLMVSLARDVARSPEAQQVVKLALQTYYPAGQEFVIRNLELSSLRFRDQLSVEAALWIFLGGAGVFIPLEMAFNRLWGFTRPRPYWHNQLVGLGLTIAFWALAVAVVLVATPLGGPWRLGALWLGTLLAAAAAILLGYRLLPHGHVPLAAAAPAAALAAIVGEVARWGFLLALPRMGLAASHGPFHVSVSFLVFVYVEAFVLLGGAFLAAEASREIEVSGRGDTAAG